MRRYKNGRYATTGNFLPIKVMLASVILSAAVYYWPKNTQAEFVSPQHDVAVIEREVEVEKIVEVEKPVAVPLGCDTEKCSILAYIVEVFQDEAANAITIIRKCENSTFDQNRTNQNRNGTKDWGIFQINDANANLCRGLDYQNNWKDNIDCAYKVYQSQSWSAWACSEQIGVTPFWKK